MDYAKKHIAIIVIFIGLVLALVWKFIKTIIYSDKQIEADVNKGLRILDYVKNKFYYHPFQFEQFSRPNGDIEDVYLVDKEGHRLHAWYHTPFKPSTNKFILFSHGNGGNLTYHSMPAAEMVDANIPFLMFDYKGFGRSEGKTYMASTYDDMLEWYEWLIKEKKVDRSSIVPMGNSIGSYPASRLAVTQNTHKLVILAGLNSISEVVRDKFGSPVGDLLAYLTYGDLNVGKWLSEYLYDPLILHSKLDEMISFRNAELNAEYGGKLVEVYGYHNNLQVDWNIILEYLNN